ncbi:hypothetical protein [Streptomyces sp. URMC 129]|uniref:hypothetical protein n=1 Tax=Streptomyces sp. URMC 129 TaxID=3423407 RepID=UPI003F19F976
MRHSTKTTIRTVIQSVTGLAAGLPLLLEASGIPETTAGVGVALTVAAAVTRVMALPLVQDQLRRVGLATDDPLSGGGGGE